MSTETKPCETCEGPIPRTLYGQRLSDKKWAKKRFCSVPCLNGRDRSKDAEPVAGPTAAESCRAHLVAIVRCGVRNGGVPDLPEWRLWELADELGIAA